MKTLRAPLLLALLFVLSACTSLTKQAEEQYGKGEFSTAASLYERALQKDPQDEQATAGLTRARQHLVEDRLLQIRQQRLSDNYQQGLDLLSGVLKDEARWKISPGGPAFATQTEETEELFTWFGHQIHTALNDGKFLKAKLFHDGYASVFNAGPLNYRNLQLGNQISQRGTAHCAQMEKSAQGPFSAEFARRYCMAWGQYSGVTAPSTTTLKAMASGVPGYGEVQLKGEIKDLPKEVLTVLSDSLLQGLKATPFYVPGGPALTVHLEGQFISDYNESPFVALHSYQVQVPYQVQVTIPYQENVTVPYQTSEYVSEISLVTDPVTGAVTHVPRTELREVTHYRTESQTRYRDEWETRYRDEARSFSYPATEFHLVYKISASAAFNLDKVQHQLPITDELNLTDTFHDSENRAIGLFPKSKSAPTSASWLISRFQSAGQLLGDRVAASWDDKYCQVPAAIGARQQTESVMKCLRGTRSGHKFVESWFESRFGLSYAQVKQAIGVFR